MLRTLCSSYFGQMVGPRSPGLFRRHTVMLYISKVWGLSGSVLETWWAHHMGKASECNLVAPYWYVESRVSMRLMLFRVAMAYTVLLNGNGTALFHALRTTEMFGRTD